MVKEVRASHILVTKNGEVKCKEILADIKAGKITFANAAKANSECPSKKNGGDLGYFTRGKMVKCFEDPAFAGKKGDLVGPFKSEFGWHIMLIVDQK
ncbi:MAG TPA: peptidylprolyl isomerase [Methanomassiliicoccales archaeon]|nr:peptidylprolyl isomerase [Methanomassiliicoccales archaeon]